MLSKTILFFCLLLPLQSTKLLAEEETKKESKPLSIEERLDRRMKEKETPWKKFPAIEANNISGSSTVKIVPKKGEALVLVFLASWCVPCQLMIGELKRMERKHNNSFSRFVYIFTHDTKADASAFIKTHQLGTAVLATRKIIELFNQPSLPSIFVADRQSLMVMRRLGFDEKGLNEVDRFLDLHNSL